MEKEPKNSYFDNLEVKPDINEMRKKVLEFWENDKTFEKSVSKENTGEVVFYDGPPFPTSTPHWGTILVSYIKDMVARYHTMQGKSVPRGWGWDCHGLPVEEKVEKKLGILDKTEIENRVGIAKFNDECRDYVLGANEAWKKYVKNMARWVDYDNSYKTMDTTFMESVIWAFKTCYEKGLIYKDFRVTPYCTRCRTPLSLSDTRESDSTRPRQDRYVMVKFDANEIIDGKKVFYISWTTTPWTLPSNVALAIGECFDYVYFQVNNEVFVACENCIGNFEKVFGKDPIVLKRCKGSDLLGKKYTPLFTRFENLSKEGAYKIISADFVDNKEGVGIVHIAPAYGEDDYWACKKNMVPMINTVDDSGCFTDDVPEFVGRHVIESNPDVIRLLKDRGQYVSDGTIVHNYPHCWRCREPLIYKAVDAWYLNIEKLKPRLLELNKSINWVPETVKNGRFGNWLENARDWNLSRNRYWSTPIPVWQCDECGEHKVLGSIDEIYKESGIKLTDLHRQYMDKVTIKCPKCGKVMHRVPEVLDGWFESASVPFAQMHYPFENKDWFDSHYPCDFIVEYTGQIRCWFYYLHVIATALFDKPSFKNCIVHGTILAKDGKKMSKSLKNYTDPLELIDKYGSDAVRLYLFNSNAMLLNDLSFDDDGPKEPLQKILLPLWNSCYFYKSYADIDKYVGTCDLVPEPKNILDSWILAKLYQTEKAISKSMSNYDVDQYLQPIYTLIDGLTNWYIRRSRRRFWASGMSDDKKSAYDTMYYVLTSICKICAPVAPLWTEKLYKSLTGKESVHLELWPSIPQNFKNEELLNQIASLQDIIALARSIRNENNIKNRQPLSKLLVAFINASHKNTIKKFNDIICEELNVKTVDFVERVDEIATVKYLPNFAVLSKKYGSDVGAIIKAIKSGEIIDNGDKILVNSGSEKYNLDKEDVLVNYLAKVDMPVKSMGDAIVSMDLTITDELKQEGIAREIVRNIQDSRKTLNCQMTDKIKISLNINLPSQLLEYICNETLSVLADVKNPDFVCEVDIDGIIIRVAIKK